MSWDSLEAWPWRPHAIKNGQGSRGAEPLVTQEGQSFLNRGERRTPLALFAWTLAGMQPLLLMSPRDDDAGVGWEG